MRLLPLVLLAALAACDTLPEVSNEMEPEGTATVLAQGRFENRGGQQVSGTYRIERAGNDLRLVLAENFMSDDGPDLHVVLSPLTAAAVGDRTATEGSVVVGALRAESGVQVYDLPDDLVWSGYRSVLVHCVRYSHLFGAAPLAATAAGG